MYIRAHFTDFDRSIASIQPMAQFDLRAVVEYLRSQGVDVSVIQSPSADLDVSLQPGNHDHMTGETYVLFQGQHVAYFGTENIYDRWRGVTFPRIQHMRRFHEADLQEHHAWQLEYSRRRDAQRDSSTRTDCACKPGAPLTPLWNLHFGNYDPMGAWPPTQSPVVFVTQDGSSYRGETLVIKCRQNQHNSITCFAAGGGGTRRRVWLFPEVYAWQLREETDQCGYGWVTGNAPGKIVSCGHNAGTPVWAKNLNSAILPGVIGHVMDRSATAVEQLFVHQDSNGKYLGVYFAEDLLEIYLEKPVL